METSAKTGMNIGTLFEVAVAIIRRVHPEKLRKLDLEKKLKNSKGVPGLLPWKALGRHKLDLPPEIGSLTVHVGGTQSSRSCKRPCRALLRHTIP